MFKMLELQKRQQIWLIQIRLVKVTESLNVPLWATWHRLSVHVSKQRQTT